MSSAEEGACKDVQEFLERVIRDCGLRLEVKVGVLEDGSVAIDLAGEDEGLVLSESGRLLYALNHLVNQVFFRRMKGSVAFRVDCGGYRSLRERELSLLAEKAAERARTWRSKVVLQPMPAAERRIVHLALAGRADVRTESEGRGRNRRVTIVAVEPGYDG